MPQPIAAKQSTVVQDPVCGMEISADSTFATRQVGAGTFYFCSERCVQQFDREHAASATTGVSEGGGLRWIDLPLVTTHRHQGGGCLEDELLNIPGVSQVTFNSGTRLVRVQYDPSVTGIDVLVKGVRSAGYTVGSATTRLGV